MSVIYKKEKLSLLTPKPYPHHSVVLINQVRNLNFILFLEKDFGGH